MTKKILSVSLLMAIGFVAFFSCKKANNNTGDATRNYFPLVLGKYITYAVDSIYYNDTDCTQYEVKSQMKYAITDTFTDKKKRLSYIMDVYSRPYDGAVWHSINAILITPTSNSLLYSQDNVQYVKMMFPVVQGFSWKGNQYAQTNIAALSYLKNWDYTYQAMNKSYNTNYVNFDNTVTVLENDESVNYPNVDSAVNAYRTYAKEVYAYNVGMVYKEWTHWTYKADTVKCVGGYRVIMQAIDHN